MKIDNNYSVWSSQVFTILALCAHEPLPLGTFNRFLAAKSNDDPSWRIQAIKAESNDNPSRKIQAIKDCDLLTFLPKRGKPTDSYDEVERVYFYEHAHKAFKDIFIRRGEWPYAFLVSCLKHRNDKENQVYVFAVYASYTFELVSFPGLVHSSLWSICHVICATATSRLNQ